MFLVRRASLEFSEELSGSIIFLDLAYISAHILFPRKLLLVLFLFVALSVVRRIGSSIMQKLRNGIFSFCLVPLKLSKKLHWQKPRSAGTYSSRCYTPALLHLLVKFEAGCMFGY